jgi:hypothetical protein
LAVAGPQQIIEEPLEPHGEFVDEFLGVKPFIIKRVCDSEHQGNVGVGTQRNPFGSNVLSGLGPDRIDRNHRNFRAPGLELIERSEHAMVGRGVTDDVVGDQFIAPQHNQTAVIENARPGGLAAARIDLAGHVREDHLRGAGAVVARIAGNRTVQRKHPLEQGGSVMQLADAGPSVAPVVDGLRAEFALHPFQFRGDEPERFVPSNPDEIATPPFAAVRGRTFPQIVRANHRILDPMFRIQP